MSGDEATKEAAVYTVMERAKANKAGRLSVGGSGGKTRATTLHAAFEPLYSSHTHTLSLNYPLSLQPILLYIYMLKCPCVCM